MPSQDDGRGNKTAARNRRRILQAGAELLHGFPAWRWDALTVPAVAARAGVTERTVYRHFGAERVLRDAVMEYLLADADLAMDSLDLDEVAEVARRIRQYASHYPVASRVSEDPTVAATNARQRTILLAALEPHTPSWSASERRAAAAIIDVLWGGVTYERMIIDWELEPAAAIGGVTWAIRLIETAIRAGQPPTEDS